LRFSQGQVSIEAGQGDDAQASEAVEATLTGPEIEIAFNPQFLLDGLGAIEEKVVELAFTQASKPVVMSGSSGDGGAAEASGFRYLLMPRRLLS
ncbi:MAG: DNA polymerase III subunit beta, partial [Nocardioides sp.]|nr:DNA polymerase III subunit beta [Nocardioides sp.]